MKRGRPVLRGLIAAGLSWLLLIGAITVGMIVPRVELLRGFETDGRLDYSAYFAAFSPLSLGFIADVLGLDDARSAHQDGSGDESEAVLASTGAPTPGVLAGGPTEVNHPFTNDDVEGAYPITHLPFRARTDTKDASRAPDEPYDCSPTGGTAWYRYRPSAKVALFADTFGTSRATALGVYAGRSLGSLRLIACDRNVLGNAQVGFRAKARVTYWFQLTGVVHGGPTVFELAEVGPTTAQTVTPSGDPADGPAFDHPDISADGRWVAFNSYAQNLTRKPPKCGKYSYCTGLYLRDRLTGKTSLIAAQGTPYPPDRHGPQISLAPSLSADGRYVAFDAYSFLFSGDYEGYAGPRDAERPAWNVYLYDRVTDRTKLVSRNSAGEPARRDPVVNGYGPFGGSTSPSLSARGRYVIFNSDAKNLGAPVEPAEFNVYRRDLLTGTTRLVSTDPSGEPNRADNCAGTGRNISADGRYVTYMSSYGTSSDQVAFWTGAYLVYLWDARTGRSRLVSKVPQDSEIQGNYCPAISADGSRVAFVSRDALVADDTNGTPDVYAYEVATGRLQRISVTSAGEQTHDPNYEGRENGFLRRSVNLSADGRFAVFDSAAPDLAPSAVGGTRHQPETTRVFLHDILTGATVLVSVSSTGEPLPGDSYMPYISANGRSVVFMNVAPSGLVNVVVHDLSIFR